MLIITNTNYNRHPLETRCQIQTFSSTHWTSQLRQPVHCSSSFRGCWGGARQAKSRQVGEVSAGTWIAGVLNILPSPRACDGPQCSETLDTNSEATPMSRAPACPYNLLVRWTSLNGGQWRPHPRSPLEPHPCPAVDCLVPETRVKICTSSSSRLPHPDP